MIDSIDTLAERYQSNQPFPHIVLNNVFKKQVLKNLEDSFPKQDQTWKHFNGGNHKELRKSSYEGIRLYELEHARDLCTYLNGDEFCSWLEKLTGIENIIANKKFLGGGLHEIGTGGYLGIHVDFNKHDRMFNKKGQPLDRRLNILI